MSFLFQSLGFFQNRAPDVVAYGGQFLRLFNRFHGLGTQRLISLFYR